ncbi:MAG: FAD-dependent oxidoreductase [[Clostridium] scindens]
MKGEISSLSCGRRPSWSSSGVEVRYQTELTKAIVEEEKPDTVVVATGSHPFVPPFPGKDQEFVVSAVDLLRGKIQADGNIAVIGGGLVGGETANFLATHGNQGYDHRDACADRGKSRTI